MQSLKGSDCSRHRVEQCQTHLNAEPLLVKRHRAALKLSLYQDVRNSINIIDQCSGLGSFLHEYTGRKWLLL